RSDPDLIEKVYGLARSHGAITILDIQAGKSPLKAELPVIEKFLSRPDVHVGIDPEFHMHHNREGRVPGTKIGSMTAAPLHGGGGSPAHSGAQKHGAPTAQLL